MSSPVDGDHPVAGNRRFGIFPDVAKGGYCFYARGVDRVYSQGVTVINAATNLVFSGADDLWRRVRKGVINQVNANGGEASLYTTGGEVVKRPDWNGPIKSFLQGKITLAQLRSSLNCLD